MRTRRRFKTLLSGTGMLCLILLVGFLAGGQYAKYLTRQRQQFIMENFEKQIAERYMDSGHLYTGTGKNDYTAVEGETIAILRLDRLGVKVSVAEGTDREVLKVSAGHFTGTAFPGDGNFAIAGHSSDEYVCLFNDLDQALVGDEIIVITREKKHQYMVSEIITAKPEETSYVCQTNESILTIVTCTDSGTARLIIQAVEVT